MNNKEGTLKEKEIKGFKCLFLKDEIRYIKVLNPILSEHDLETLATVFQTAKIGELAEKRIRISERNKVINDLIKQLEFLKEVFR